MSDDDKPFGCSFTGCLQRFSTHDRLSVHVQTHEKRPLSLDLPSRGSEPLTLVDQTPTPSRFLGNFLKNYEESGLDTPAFGSLSPVQSIVSNPFAETFKNASNSPKPNLKLNVPLANSEHDDSLNTPSIDVSLEEEAAKGPPLPVRQDGFIVPTAHDIPLADREPKHVNPSSESTKHIAVPITSVVTNVNHTAIRSFPVSVICSSSINAANAGVSQEQLVVKSPAIVSKPTPPIANGVRLNNKSILMLPKVPNSSPAIAVQPIQPPVSQLLLALPNGGAFKIPVMQTTVLQPEKILVNPIIKPKEEPRKILNGLQQVIRAASSLSSLKDSTCRTSPSFAAKLPIITTTATASSIPLSSSLSISASLNSSATSVASSLDSMVSVRGKPGRRSKNAPQEDPNEKKVRSLERNRAAAMRCRKKRKKWIEDLEENAQVLEKMNEKLQEEVTVLRNEVTTLKTALMAHKDCPVTIQQLKVANRQTGGVIASGPQTGA